MSIRYRYFSLVDSSEARRRHDHDTVLPLVKVLRNLYASKSDRVPTLRPDLAKDSSDFEAYSDSLDGTGVSVIDVMNSIVQTFNETAYFSSLVPFIITAGSAVTKMATYDDGLTAAFASGSATVTGNSTTWLRDVWPGCFIRDKTGSKTYQITKVSSDTSITINGTAETSSSPADYEIYKSHYDVLAKYPLRIEQWGQKLIYQAVNPLGPDNEYEIAGPFQNIVGIPNYDFTDLTTNGEKIWFPSGSSNWFRIEGSATFQYTDDPSGDSWSTPSTKPTTVVRDVMPGESAVSTPNIGCVAGTHKSFMANDIDGEGVWVAKGDTTEEMYVLAYDSVNSCWAAAGTNNVRYSDDYMVTWTQSTSVPTGIPTTPVGMVFDGTNLILTGEYHLSKSSDGGDNWTNVTIPSSINQSSISDIATDGNGTTVIVGRAGTGSNASPIIFDDGNGWRGSKLRAINTTFYSVEWSGTYFLAAGALIGVGYKPLLYYSNDGENWTKIDATEMGNTGIRQAVPSDSNMTEILIRTGTTGTIQDLWWADPSTAEVFTDFSEVSDLYRSVSFAVGSNYFVMVGTYEWNDGGENWVYYPRRARYAVPGTATDFSGIGSGFVDCPGTGYFRDAQSVGESFITLESNGVGVLYPTGNLIAPFGYRKINDSVYPISNSISVNSFALFIGNDGKLYKANEAGVEPVGEFDLTKYDDFDITGPIWIGYNSDLGCFTVFKYHATAPLLFLISEEAGSITEISLPVPSGNQPYSVFSEDVPESYKLYVGYQPISDSSKCVLSYFNTGSAITGTDTVDTLTAYWYAMVETGESRVTQEGVRAFISQLELKTSNDASNSVDFCVEIQNEPKDLWQVIGDDNGTIALTVSTCVGTSTLWSNTIASGDDVTKVFSTPCIASQGRYYVDTTLLVENTDYTVTGTNQITLTTALASGTVLYVYWENLPNVVVASGDFIRSTTDDIFHRISSLTNYYTAVLGTYPSKGDTGTHYTAGNISGEDDDLVTFGIGYQTNDFKLRIYIIPRTNGTATRAKIYGYLVRYKEAGLERR